jgi:ABC-type multidrug transport system ATPase subunit
MSEVGNLLDVRAVGVAGDDPAHPRLSPLSFTLAPGETVALLGPAEAGKSTLMRILAGALRAYTGGVFYQGKELGDWSREFFETMGAVVDPPGNSAFLTVRENLVAFARLYRGADTARVDLLLERCGLAARAGERAGGLTVDDQVLAALARAQIHNPALLLVDLPGEGLSPSAAQRVADAVRTRQAEGGATVVAVRYADWAAACCDRVVKVGAP